MTILPIQKDRNQNGKYSGSLHTQSATPEWPSRMENDLDVRRGEEQPTKIRQRDRRHAMCVIANETRDFRASRLMTPWHVTNQPMKICKKIDIYLCLCQDQSVEQWAYPKLNT